MKVSDFFKDKQGDADNISEIISAINTQQTPIAPMANDFIYRRGQPVQPFNDSDNIVSVKDPDLFENIVTGNSIEPTGAASVPMANDFISKPGESGVTPTQEHSIPSTFSNTTDSETNTSDVQHETQQVINNETQPHDTTHIEGTSPVIKEPADKDNQNDSAVATIQDSLSQREETELAASQKNTEADPDINKNAQINPMTPQTVPTVQQSVEDKAYEDSAMEEENQAAKDMAIKDTSPDNKPDNSQPPNLDALNAAVAKLGEEKPEPPKRNMWGKLADGVSGLLGSDKTERVEVLEKNKSQIPISADDLKQVTDYVNEYTNDGDVATEQPSASIPAQTTPQGEATTEQPSASIPAQTTPQGEAKVTKDTSMDELMKKAKAGMDSFMSVNKGDVDGMEDIKAQLKSFGTSPDMFPGLESVTSSAPKEAYSDVSTEAAKPVELTKKVSDGIQSMNAQLTGNLGNGNSVQPSGLNNSNEGSEPQGTMQNESQDKLPGIEPGEIRDPAYMQRVKAWERLRGGVTFINI